MKNPACHHGQPAGRRLRKPFVAAALTAMLAGCAHQQPPIQVAMPAPAPATAPAVPAAPAPVPSPVPAPALPAQTQPPAAPADKGAILRTWAEQQDRLYRVAAPLLINNTELCPRHVRNLLGFTAKTRYSYTAEFAEAAQTALALDERLRVTNVLPGSGAEQAGLRKGDALFAVEIEPLPQGPNAESASAAIIGAELQGRNSVSLTVLRGGERIVHQVPLTPSCAMVIDLGNAAFADSFADGQRVMVTRGMLETVQSDGELAYALAREIARNILAPEPRPEAAAVIDRLHTLTPVTAEDGAAAALPPWPAELELRARKLALYLLARAGYAIDAAPDFWEKMENPAVTDGYRVELAETIGAIGARLQLGGPLLPE